MVAVVGGPADGRRVPLPNPLCSELVILTSRPIRWEDYGPTFNPDPFDPVDPLHVETRYWLRYSDLVGWVAVVPP